MSETQGAVSAGSEVLAERYELVELIGRGGMAQVYRGHDRLLDRAVAVKLFRAHADARARTRFDDEAHALARLAHPGLVSIFDVNMVADRPFLVMEFVEGMSLQSRLLDGSLGSGQMMRIGGVLAEALAHAHERGVVHRDVKPSNIMLDRDDVPHLTDFGIALLTGAPRRTGANEIVGTPAYLAPEQLSDGEVGPPADVYALALVLLECVTGEVEYPTGSSLEVALTRLNRPPRIPVSLPPTLASLLTAMTSINAADRPTAAECAARLGGPPEIIDTAAEPERPAAISPAAGRSVAWWADADKTELVSAPTGPGTTQAVRAGSRRQVLAASVTGIAAVIVALVVLLNAQQSPIGGQPTGAGHAQSGATRGTSTSRPRGTVGGTGGPVSSAHVARAFVASGHSVPAPAATTPSAAVSPTSAESRSAPAKTSPTASAPVTTTPPSRPPTTSSSSVPPPTSTTGAPGAGQGGG